MNLITHNFHHEGFKHMVRSESGINLWNTKKLKSSSNNEMKFSELKVIKNMIKYPEYL